MPRRKLLRSDKDRIIAGVLGGLGGYLKVDANILRVFTVALFIVAPLPTIILYLAAVFLIPREGEEKPLASEFNISQHKNLIIGLILLLVGATFAGPYTFGPFFLSFTPYVFIVLFKGIIAAILIIIGIILILTHLRKL